MKKPPVFIGRG